MMTFLILSLAVNAMAKEPVSIATGESGVGWSPNVKNYGYVLHVVSEAFADAGLDVDIDFYPWKRAFVRAQGAENDATCCWFFVEKRAKDFYYSDPVFEETMVFFHLKSFKLDWKTYEDLRGLWSGGNIGFHYGDDFQAAEKSGIIIVDRVRHNDVNFKKLLAGRIQVHPIAVIAGFGHLHKLFPPEKVDLFTYHPRPVLQKTLHLLVPKKMEKTRVLRLLSSFNQGLRRLRKNGKLARIKKDAETGGYKIMKKKWQP